MTVGALIVIYQVLNLLIARWLIYELNPVWSPDGQSIAYVCYKPTLFEAISLVAPRRLDWLGASDPYSLDSSEICVMNADGSGRRQLTHNRVWDHDPIWSPDNKHIAFASYGGDDEWGGRTYGVYLINAESGQERRVARIGSGLDWAPSGDQIALINHGIYLVDIRTGVEEELSRDGGWPAWSPNGEYVAYQENWSSCKLKIVKVVTRAVEEITPQPMACYKPPSWSPDGSRLAFIAQEALNINDTQLMVYDLMSDTATPVTDSSRDIVGGPVWGLDGASLFFLSEDIYAVQADGSGLRRITHFDNASMTFVSAKRNSFMKTLALSPDGTELVFTLGQGREYNPGIKKIFKVKTDGSQPTQLSP